MKIGIGITTHNRTDMFYQTLERIIDMSPRDFKIVTVDDASEPAVPNAINYRFNENVGVATAKNKCLELLDDCDHIFLFDDDTYPIKKDWWKPYVQSKEPHLMYLFDKWSNGKSVGDDVLQYSDDSIVAHTHSRGCMLYIKHKVLEVVGGMDVRYGKAMEEHVDWSNRIYNSALTSFRFMDVVGSDKLIYSADQHQKVVSSILSTDRYSGLKKNKQLLEDSFTSTRFAPYKGRPSNQNNIVLTSYFTNQVDLQRGVKWKADPKNVKKLHDSVVAQGLSLVTLNDCFDDGSGIGAIRVSSSINPYFQRWLSQYQYLRDHPEIDNVFCVDATDVEMLRNPFPEMEEGKVYTGDEPDVLGKPWMISNHRHEPIAKYISYHRRLPLLNCGIVGGSRDHVMEICHDMIKLYFDGMMKETLDMGAFNYILRTKWGHRVVNGRQVNTVFKKFQPDNGMSWWRHK